MNTLFRSFLLVITAFSANLWASPRDNPDQPLESLCSTARLHSNDFEDKAGAIMAEEIKNRFDDNTYEAVEQLLEGAQDDEGLLFSMPDRAKKAVESRRTLLTVLERLALSPGKICVMSKPFAGRILELVKRDTQRFTSRERTKRFVLEPVDEYLSLISFTIQIFLTLTRFDGFAFTRFPEDTNDDYLWNYEQRRDAWQNSQLLTLNYFSVLRQVIETENQMMSTHDDGYSYLMEAKDFDKLLHTAHNFIKQIANIATQQSETKAYLADKWHIVAGLYQTLPKAADKEPPEYLAPRKFLETIGNGRKNELFSLSPNRFLANYQRTAVHLLNGIAISDSGTVSIPEQGIGPDSGFTPDPWASAIIDNLRVFAAWRKVSSSAGWQRRVDNQVREYFKAIWRLFDKQRDTGESLRARKIQLRYLFREAYLVHLTEPEQNRLCETRFRRYCPE